MAKELTVHLSFKFEREGSVVEKDFGYRRIDVSADALMHQRISVGTSTEAIPLGDTGTEGLLFVENHDDSNFIEIGDTDNATDIVVVKAGEVAMLRISADVGTPYFKADTAACDVEYWLLSD